MAAAGGAVSSTTTVDASAVAPESKTLVDSLGSQLATQLHGLVDASQPTYVRLGQLLGGSVATTTPQPAAPTADQGTLRSALSQSKLITGQPGQAMAPLLFAPFVQQFGLRATPVLMIPALIALVAVLLRRIPTFDRLQEHHQAGGLAALRPYAKPLTLLYLIVVLRTLTAMSFSTFLPVLLTRRGQSLAQAGTVVSIYLIAVGLGGFVGGSSADRFGPRRVINQSIDSRCLAPVGVSL